MPTTREKRPLSEASNMTCSRCFAIVLALVCVLPIATPSQKGGTDQKAPPPLGKLVDVGGYRVHLYCIGTGSPTVVIVGAGFSFNWGLVQPEVAGFAQVCSYDHSGIGWSDDGPKDSCSLRVSEVHTALKNAGIKWPANAPARALTWWIGCARLCRTVSGRSSGHGFCGPRLRVPPSASSWRCESVAASGTTDDVFDPRERNGN